MQWAVVCGQSTDGGVAQAGDPGQPVDGADRVNTRTGDHAAVPNQGQFGKAEFLGDNVHGFDERGRVGGAAAEHPDRDGPALGVGE